MLIIEDCETGRNLTWEEFRFSLFDNEYHSCILPLSAECFGDGEVWHKWSELIFDVVRKGWARLYARLYADDIVELLLLAVEGSDGDEHGRGVIPDEYLYAYQSTDCKWMLPFSELQSDAIREFRRRYPRFAKRSEMWLA